MIRIADLIVHTRSGYLLRARFSRIAELQDAMNTVKLEPGGGSVEYLTALSPYCPKVPEKNVYDSDSFVYQYAYVVHAMPGRQPDVQQFTTYLLGIAEVLGGLGARFEISQSDIPTGVVSGGSGTIGVPVAQEKPLKKFQVSLSTKATVEWSCVVKAKDSREAEHNLRMSQAYREPRLDAWKIAGLLDSPIDLNAIEVP